MVGCSPQSTKRRARIAWLHTAKRTPISGSTSWSGSWITLRPSQNNSRSDNPIRPAAAAVGLAQPQHVVPIRGDVDLHGGDRLPKAPVAGPQGKRRRGEVHHRQGALRTAEVPELQRAARVALRAEREFDGVTRSTCAHPLPPTETASSLVERRHAPPGAASTPSAATGQTHPG